MLLAFEDDVMSWIRVGQTLIIGHGGWLFYTPDF